MNKHQSGPWSVRIYILPNFHQTRYWKPNVSDNTLDMENKNGLFSSSTQQKQMKNISLKKEANS